MSPTSTTLTLGVVIITCLSSIVDIAVAAETILIFRISPIASICSLERAIPYPQQLPPRPYRSLLPLTFLTLPQDIILLSFNRLFDLVSPSWRVTKGFIHGNKDIAADFLAQRDYVRHLQLQNIFQIHLEFMKYRLYFKIRIC
jgi:hypothetical protein